MSQFKVRVVAGRGTDSTEGLIDPQVGMVTQFGTIAAVDAPSGICTMGDTSVHLHGGRQRFYAHQLQILVADAGAFGWPSSGGSVVFGHHSEDVILAAEVENRKAYAYAGPGGKPVIANYP